MSYVRRLLYTPQYVAGFARALREARADLDAQHRRHLSDLADLRRELDLVRTEYTALRNAVIEREKAEANLVLLQRDRARQMSIAEGRVVWLH
jgi:hypothetical protein